MSLYGLDIMAESQTKRIYLVEINGVNSGMKGFETVYGDDRARQKVWQMLGEEYGSITANYGHYTIKKFRQEHPVGHAIAKLINMLPRHVRAEIMNMGDLRSPKALLDWKKEKIERHGFEKVPFPVYTGQESTVLNVKNEQLPHPLVNPFVAEEIAGNKLLQYILLRETKLAEYLPETAAVGFGVANRGKLEKMLEEHDSFCIKPICGSGGRGFMGISREDVEEYLRKRGPAYQQGIFLDFTGRNAVYFEDLVDMEDFSFEDGIAVIQPFIDTKGGIGGENEHVAIRAIVCNGQFVDAYARSSPNPRVNLSQGARAVALNSRGLDKFCEMAVREFEEECAKFRVATFRKELYSRLLDEIGRTSKTQRALAAMVPIVHAMRGLRL